MACLGSDVYVRSLCENLFELQQTGVLCDVVIQLDNCQLAAHRVVLAAASPYLRTIITAHEAEEGQGGSMEEKQIIHLKDCNSDDARLWLEFVYTGKADLPNSVKQFHDVLSLFEALGMQKPDWTVDLFEMCPVKEDLSLTEAEATSRKGFESSQSQGSNEEHESSSAGEILKSVVTETAEPREYPIQQWNSGLAAVTRSVNERLRSGIRKSLLVNLSSGQKCFKVPVESENVVLTSAELKTDPIIGLESQNGEFGEGICKTEMPTDDIDANSTGEFPGEFKVGGKTDGKTEQTMSTDGTIKSGASLLKANTKSNFRSRLAKKKTRRKKLASEESFDCNYCGRTFSRAQAFRHHMKVHTDGRPYKCNMCGDSFRFLTRLSKHAWLFHQVLICDKCGPDCHCLPAPGKEAGREEVRYPCDICSKTFARYQSLVEHRVVHSGDASRDFICEVCGKGFRRKGQLSLHQALHSSKPYSCNICSRVFVNSVRLEEHLRKHTGECPIQCDTCGKRFRSRKALRMHQDKHTGVVHQCDVCGRNFSSKAYLLMHVDAHKNGRSRSHICDLCDKAFFDKNTLRKHRSTHDEVRDRPFICSVCGKSFLSRGSLKTHAMFHLDDRPYKCSTCNKGFKLKSHFNRHCKIHQKNIGSAVDEGLDYLQSEDTSHS